MPSPSLAPDTTQSAGRTAELAATDFALTDFALTDFALTDFALTEFQSVRGRLFGIAYRILGNAADAEDVVQEVWIRWQRSEWPEIRDRTAFLVTVTTRVALTVATSARWRHEMPAGDAMSGVVHPCGDPVADIELADEVARAINSLLQRLSPLEFAVFVLREAFDYSFRDIARTLGRAEPHTRQLARRARLRLSGASRVSVDAEQRRRVLGAFREAAGSGEMSRLEGILSETAGAEEAA